MGLLIAGSIIIILVIFVFVCFGGQSNEEPNAPTKPTTHADPILDDLEKQARLNGHDGLLNAVNEARSIKGD